MEKCLHCAIMSTIDAWVNEHGDRSPDGAPIFDIVNVIEHLANCTVSVAEMAPDRSRRRRAHRYAHDALTAHLQSKQTGKSVLVNIPVEH